MSRRVRVSLPLMAVLAILSMGSYCGGGGGGPPPCRREGMTNEEYAEAYPEWVDEFGQPLAADTNTGGGGGGGGENCTQQ